MVMGGLGEQMLVDGEHPAYTQGNEHLDALEGNSQTVYPCEADCGFVARSVAEAQQHRLDHSRAELYAREEDEQGGARAAMDDDERQTLLDLPEELKEFHLLKSAFHRKIAHYKYFFPTDTVSLLFLYYYYYYYGFCFDFFFLPLVFF